MRLAIWHVFEAIGTFAANLAAWAAHIQIRLERSEDVEL